MARPKTHNEELAELLLAEGRAQITAEGLDSLNLRSLASACNTSTAAIYALFNGKEPFIAQIVINVIQEYVTAQSSVILTGNPDQDVEALSRMYRLWAHNNAHIYVAIYQGRYTETAFVDTLIDEALGAWYEVVEEARDRGYTTDDVETIIFRMWQTLHGGIMLELGNTLVPNEELILSSVIAQIHYSSEKSIHPGERTVLAEEAAKNASH